MAIKRILVPVTGAASDASALDTALIAARRFGAHVDVLHVARDPLDTVPLTGEGISGAIVEELMEQVERQNAADAEVSRSRFAEWQKRHDVAMATTPGDVEGVTAAWRRSEGRPETALGREGRLVDLIVMARAGKDDPAFAVGLVETAIFRTGRPVLLAPEAAPKTLGRRVAIAWNGSLEAAGAMQAAMPILEAAESVVVLTAVGEGLTAEDAKAVSDALSWHGIAADVDTFEPARGEDLADRITAESDRVGADLLVMGAYTHSRLREFVFGGVTESMLTAGRLPVLMVH